MIKKTYNQSFIILNIQIFLITWLARNSSNAPTINCLCRYFDSVSINREFRKIGLWTHLSQAFLWVGSPRSIFTFLLFLTEGNGIYQEIFSVWKNIIPSQSNHILKSRKYIQLHWACQLKSRFAKNFLKTSSPTVFEVQSWYLVVMF